MSRRVYVDLGDRGYYIHIGHEPDMAGLTAVLRGRRTLLVTDSNVAPLYAERFAGKLAGCELEVHRHTVASGEASKDLDVLRDVYAAAVEAGLDRSSSIAALGGGVVGDLAGFAAATFLRGIALVQFPTSLLAMVDSSVGGKTAVNLPQGKNLVGAFHQPSAVYIGLETLATLPDREYLSGLAEVAKYGVIWDAVLFGRLEHDAERLLARDPVVLEEVIARSCEIKAEVVAMDERESGVRAILNFGHTLAHALEQVCGYGTWLHGEAVAAGMAFAAELSVTHCGLSPDERDRIVRLLERLGLPVRATGASGGGGAHPPCWDALRAAIATDKKARARVPRFVLAERLGSVAFNCEVPEDELERAYEAWQG